MTIHVCDNCKEEIDRNNAINVGRGIFGSDVVLCESCAKPIIDFISSIGMSVSEKRTILDKKL